MTCEEVIAHLSSYLDHEMDAALVAEVQEHIAQCRNCRVVLDTHPTPDSAAPRRRTTHHSDGRA